MRYFIKMKSVIIRFVLFLVIFQFCGCGLDISGSFSGKVDGKKITIHFRDGKSAVLEGYFPVTLVGTWVEEKTFKEPQVWVTFNGPEEKPFRLRYELKQEGESFRLLQVKARPLGKGTQLTPVKINGQPILSPL